VAGFEFRSGWFYANIMCADFKVPLRSAQGDYRSGLTMDQQTDTPLDQADEDILTDTVSDEALEAAGTEGGSPGLFPTSPIPATTISCC
jgi:hypothetical protein